MPTTRTITVYKYDELSETAKDHAINRLSDINIDYEWWDIDGLLDLSEHEMFKRHIKLSDKWWEKSPHANIPGEYPAYTGLFKYKIAAFDIERDWYVQFDHVEITDENIFRQYLRIPKRLWRDKVNWYFDNPRNRSNTELVIECSQAYFTDKEQEIIDRAIEIMSDKIQEALSSLRNEAEYRTSREAIEETIRINEYDFDSEGNLA